MNSFLFRVCWLTAVLLNWIPGFCRYYTVELVRPTPADWVPRFQDMRRRWGWRWQADWGFRLLAKLGALDAFADECQLRWEKRNPSSGS